MTDARAGTEGRWLIPEWKPADIDVRYRHGQDCTSAGCGTHIARFRYHSASDTYSITWDLDDPERSTWHFDETMMWMLEKWAEYLRRAHTHDEDVWDGTLVSRERKPHDGGPSD